MSKRLTRNAAQCLDCATIVESTHVHDFQSCDCGNIFVDGGLEYRRFGFIHGDRVLDLCEYMDVPEGGDAA